MELRHLRYFVAVAEELHFGRAAQRLHIVQPALSKQISSLEQEVGFDLFLRTNRGVVFTPAGSAFYEEARSILERADRAMDVARMTATGKLGSLNLGFIGPAMWSLVPLALERYRREVEGVRFRLQELPSSQQVGLLHDGRLDAGFVRPPVYDDALTTRVVAREPMVVGLPRRHPAAQLEVVDLSDLAGETFILTPRRASPGFFDRCIDLCRENGFAPQEIEEGNTPGAMYGMVRANLGITLAPASAADAAWHEVQFRPLTKTLPVELAVAFRSGETHPVLEQFLAVLADVIGERDGLTA